MGGNLSPYWSQDEHGPRIRTNKQGKTQIKALFGLADRT